MKEIRYKKILLCKQKHRLLSRNLYESCSVKMLQRRTRIPQNFGTREVHIKSTVWHQLYNKEWIYFLNSSGTIKLLFTK